MGNIGIKMGKISRRNVIAGGGIIGSSLLGGYILTQSRKSASFDARVPKQGTWPLIRFDSGNTASNPKATPPLENPRITGSITIPTKNDNPYFEIIINSDYIIAYGTGLVVFERETGKVRFAEQRETPVAAFGGPNEDILFVGRHRERPDGNRFEIVGYEINKNNRTKLFTNEFDFGHIDGISVDSNGLIIGTPSRQLISIDHSGEEIWRADGMYPAISDNLYAAGAESGLVSYTERSTVGNWINSGPKKLWTSGRIPGSARYPAVGKDVVILGTHDISPNTGVLCGFDVKTGERIWEPKAIGKHISTPAIKDNVGYGAIGKSGYEKGFVAAFDLANGDQIWKRPVDWYPLSPIVGGEVFIIGGEVRNGESVGEKHVRAYEIKTGEELWTKRLRTQGYIGSIASLGNMIFVTVGEGIHMIT